MIASIVVKLIWSWVAIQAMHEHYGTSKLWLARRMLAFSVLSWGIYG